MFETCCRTVAAGFYNSRVCYCAAFSRVGALCPCIPYLVHGVAVYLEQQRRYLSLALLLSLQQNRLGDAANGLLPNS